MIPSGWVLLRDNPYTDRPVLVRTDAIRGVFKRRVTWVVKLFGRWHEVSHADGLEILRALHGAKWMEVVAALMPDEEE